MAGTCAGCRQEIPDRRFLKCFICHQNYDLDCANVSEQRFYNTLTKEHKQSWKCQFCRSKEPKTDNNNTPIRPQHQSENCDVPCNQQSPTVNRNVTKRKKIASRTKENSIMDDITISPQGNTQILETPESYGNKDAIICLEEEDDHITVRKISYILQQNNQQMLSAIQTSIRKEIENVVSEIKADFKKSFEKISVDQLQLKEDLSNLNIQISQLEKKCHAIETENESLKRQIESLQSNIHFPVNETNNRILILHGLIENYWEKEEEVINRVINIFYDLLNVDISDYIEEVTFIGKRNNRRPLKIEFVNKRMKKYILENSIYLKEAGFSITEYLTPQGLQERRKLNRVLYMARQNGHHAIIKNNKLFINGKEVTDPLLNNDIIKTSTQKGKNNNYTPPRPQYITSIQSTNTNPTVTNNSSRKETSQSNFRKTF